MTGGRPRLAVGTFGRLDLAAQSSGWRARVWVRDLDGKRRRVQATASSQRKAEAALKEKLTSRPGYGGAGVLGVSSSFDELCVLWLTDLDLRDISEGTKENYRDDLRLHLRPAFEHYSLGEITTGRVEWFLKTEAAVSCSRAKHSRTLLSQLVAFALRHDALPRNPLDGTSRLKAPKRTIRALTLEQVRQIRAAAAAWRTGAGMVGPPPDGRVRDICEVLLGTSMRPGEVLGLRPVDIDDGPRGMVAHVRGTVVERKKIGCLRQDRPKTDASNRRIAVPEFAATVIRARLAELAPDQREVTIFHNRYGGVLNLHNTRRTFRDFLEGAGLGETGITMRWYRRTGATVLARGLGAGAAAAFLGHSNVAITEGHYIEPDRTLDRSPARILELTLRPISPDGALLAAGVTDEEEVILDELDGLDEDEPAA